jgi:DNA (cytosine-5)-methyltransferase 1
MMRYLSICSGIEAVTHAWHPLGWKAAAFSEIEKFPRAVLAHHYPDVPCHGDFTTIGENEYGAIDILVGGTPCQSFSIAGKRLGLDDPRGNLTLEYIKLAQRLKPKYIVMVEGIIA